MINPFAALTRFIDSTTMYRLVLYYLVALLGAALGLAFFGLVPVDPTALAFSTIIVTLTCAISNWLFALVFRTPVNLESSYITGLIIVLIMAPVPASDLAGVGGLVFASLWAIASKFMLAIGRKHLFNPAAFGVALTALLLDQPAIWWVGGNLMLLPFVLLGGIILTRKLQRFDLVLGFALANLIVVALTTQSGEGVSAISETLIHSPILFFAFVMLTEPLTAPQARWPRLAYGALVGVLSAPNIHFGDLYLTPELALLAGNLFAYAVSPKGKFAMSLVRIEQAASGAYDFIFRPDRPLRFRPGQYLEWTLGVKHPDNRGNRRQFTIASAPGETDVRLGVKFYSDASTFKRTLGRMHPGDQIYASQLAGDFVLPRDVGKKLAFVAGGIGITPFRSMLQHLIDEREARPVVVLYGNARAEDIAYKDVLEQARHELGIRTIYTAEYGSDSASGIHSGIIDRRLIETQVPDYRERLFYLSGPHAMVTAIKKTLLSMGVSPLRVKVDFFPGLA